MRKIAIAAVMSVTFNVALTASGFLENTYIAVFAWSLTVCLGLWWLYEHFKRDKRPWIKEPLIKSHTIGKEGVLVSIDGAALKEFQDSYNVAIVFVVTDPEVDQFEETRFAISSAFTIVSEIMEIAVRFTPEIMSVVRVQLEKSRHAELPGWIKTVLIPKPVKVSNIKKLSDVELHRGKIISRELDAGRFRRLLE